MNNLYHRVSLPNNTKGFCFKELEYDSILQMLCEALSWQGGTIHQVIDEIKRLKKLNNIS